MTVAEKKLSLLQQIMLMDDESAINHLLQLIQELQPSKYESFDDLPPQVRESIEVSRKQFEAGEGIPHEEVMKELRRKKTS